MRILYITEHSDRPEAETFIAVHQAGHDITVVCPSTAPQLERIRAVGIRVVEHRCPSRIDRASIRLIRSLLSESPTDIVHAFTNKTVSNAVLASRGFKHRLIAYRGIVANVSYLDPTSWMTYLNPRVDCIVCVADAIRQYFYAMTLCGIPLPVKKALTVYKGHKLEWYRDSPVSLQQFGITPDSFVIGCIANNRPRKGLEYLIEAFEQISNLADVHLLLIGNMSQGKLLDRIENSTARERIHLTGFRNDAPQIIASCQTAVLPAIKREGLPKAIIEAMVYRVPPIVTDSGGSPELIINGESGLIVPVRDSRAIAKAILSLHADEPARQRMGEKAQQRIDQAFNHRHTVEKTLALYDDLLAPGNGPASK